MTRGLRTVSPAIPRTTHAHPGADARVRTLGRLWVGRATGHLRIGAPREGGHAPGTPQVLTRLIPIFRGGLCDPEDGPAVIEGLLAGPVSFEAGTVRSAGDVLTLGASLLAAARRVVSAPSAAAVWELSPSIERVRLEEIGVSAGALGVLDGLAPDVIQLVVGEAGWQDVLLDLSALEMIGAVRAVFGLWEEGIPLDDEADDEVTDPRLPGGLALVDDSDEAVIAEARAEIRAGRLDQAAARLQTERDQRIDSALIVAWLAFAEALRGNPGCQHDFRPRHWARFARTMDPLDPEVRLLASRVEALCASQCELLHPGQAARGVLTCRSA